MPPTPRSDLYEPDGEGWAGTRLVEPLSTLAAAVTGAALVASGIGWWLHHTFVAPTRARRST